MLENRIAAWATLLGMCLAVLFPLTQTWRWDDFPISSYPMFSRGDLGSLVGVKQALLVNRDGSASAAPPAMVGSPEPMVAMMQLRRAIARGTAGELCTRIAGRAAAERPDVVEVDIVSSTFDARTYFTTSREPIRRTLEVSCAVTRAP